MPLPFKSDCLIFPNNRHSIIKRSLNTLNRVRRNAQEFNEAEVYEQQHRERLHITSPVSDQPPKDEKAWWLPIFPVHHPKKEKNCLVFYSSAQSWELALSEFCSKVQTGITLSLAYC